MNFYFKTARNKVWGKGSLWMIVRTHVKYCAGLSLGKGPFQFPSAFSVTICFFHTVHPQKGGSGTRLLPPPFPRGKHAQLTAVPLAAFVGGEEDKEDSVEEIRKFKKSRKRRKVLVMRDGRIPPRGRREQVPPCKQHSCVAVPLTSSSRLA